MKVCSLSIVISVMRRDLVILIVVPLTLFSLPGNEIAHYNEHELKVLSQVVPD